MRTLRQADSRCLTSFHFGPFNETSRPPLTIFRPGININWQRPLALASHARQHKCQTRLKCKDLAQVQKAASATLTRLPPPTW